MALNVTRYMHQYGVSNVDFGRAVVQLRAYAADEPRTHGDTSGRSRWRTTRRHAGSPSRASACSTAAKRPTAPSRWSSPARTGPLTPHRRSGIAAAASAGLFEQEIASDHYRPDLSVMDGSVALARHLFDGSGIRREEIDVAMIYDAFSPILLMQLEALGFCAFGEAKDFVADGNLGHRRRTPDATPTAASSARATSTA